MPETIVQTRELVKTFGEVRALDGVDIAVPAGVTGLVGANGAGKTTLMRILLGLSRPDSGQAEVLGSPVEQDPAGLRSRLGYMPENDCLPLDQTAADFVMYAAELAGLPTSEARHRASETLFLVGLAEERIRYIGDYSTGMKQRVKLAQAIVHDPQLALLDEPASGLDPEGREEMLQLIRRLGGFGINVLVSSHVLTDIETTCSWVVMLDGGRTVRSAPVEPPAREDTVSVEVFGDPGPLARLLAERGLVVEVADGRVTASEPAPGRESPGLTMDGEAMIRWLASEPAPGRESPGDVYEMMRDALAELEAPVRRLGADLTGLEEIFTAAAGGRDE